MNLYQPTVSGSLTVSGSIIVNGSIIMASGSISGTASLAQNSLLLSGLDSGSFVGTGSYNNFSGSVSTRLTTNEANIATNTAASASFAAQSASLSTRLTTDETNFTNLSSSFATTSGSVSSRVTLIEGQYATTGSNNFTKPQQISDVSNAISFTSTASLYTAGGLRVSKDSFVSGTAYFNNIVVYGTSSIQYITSSQLDISDNIISVNTFTPAVRFGGLAVYDSGSTGLTGSMLWDSEYNRWVYSNPSGSTYDGGMLISGPRNTTGLGNEVGTTACYLMAGQGGDHITSSAIYTDSTASCFYGQSYISSSGTAYFAGCVGVQSTTPCANLHVNSGGNYIWSTGNGYGDLYTGNGTYGLSIGTAIGGGGAGDTRMWTKGGTHTFYIGTSNVDAVKVDASQNVCVAGNLYSNGSVYANNNIRVGTTGYSVGNSTDPAITSCVYTKAGMYFTSCGVGLGTGGASKMLFLNSDGRVGIGTETPSFGNLAIICADNSTLSSALLGTSTACGVTTTIYNASQCANTVAGVRLVTRSSGASIWNIYNVSTGASTGDLVFGNGSGGTGWERLRIVDGGIACFACQVCAKQYLATFNADGDNVATFINSASSYLYGAGGIFIGASTANNCTNLAGGSGALIIRNGASTYTAAIAYNGQAYFCNCVGIGTATPQAQLQICSPDGQLRLSGDGRAQMILSTYAKAWQFETSCGAGNVSACGIGLVEAGSGTRFQIAPGGVACFSNTVCASSLILNSSAVALTLIGGTTAYSAIRICNTGGDLWVGNAGSNGVFWNNSSAAYAGTIGTNGNTNLDIATNNTVRLTFSNAGIATFSCKPSFPGASLICTYTCTYSSYTAGCWLGLFAGDNGMNGAYAFTVVGQFNLGGSGLYSMNYSTMPYIHKSDSIGSTNGNDFYWLPSSNSGHADNGALTCFRRARYSGNTPVGNRTEFCMNVSYSNSFTATTYVLAWV